MQKNYPNFNRKIANNISDIIQNIISNYTKSLETSDSKTSPSVYGVIDLALNITKNIQAPGPTNTSAGTPTLAQVQYSKVQGLVSNVIDATIDYNIKNKITTNLTSINDNYQVQLYESSMQTNTWTTSQALKYNLSLLNLTECATKIRAILHLGPNDSIPIKKVDWSGIPKGPDVSNDTISSSSTVSYGVYDPKTGKELNLSYYCSDVPVGVKIPIQNATAINMTLYEKYQLQLVNIYDPNDPFFTDICYSYVNTTTEQDVPLSIRQKNYSPNIAVKCENGCNFMGIEKGYYVICSCVNVTKTKTDIVSNIFKIITRSNIEVGRCANRIFDPVNIFLILVHLKN